MILSNSLLLGPCKSGRSEQIIAGIAKNENTILNRVYQSSDVKFINFNNSIEEIVEALENLCSIPLEFLKNYCIIKDIDFMSQDKQELFLKYIEDSDIQFYFTAFDINQIMSKALLSRLKLITFKGNYKLILNDIQKDIYANYLKLKFINSLSEIEIINTFEIDLNKLIKFDNDYYDLLNSLKIKLINYHQYPIWYTLNILYTYMVYIINIEYVKDIAFMRVIKQLFNIYNKSNLLYIDTFTSLLTSYYISNKIIKNAGTHV